MTSKEVNFETLTNEEVLEILTGNVDYKDYSSNTMSLVNKSIERLWRVLERLEELEKENKKAQTYFIEAQKILNNDINNLLTENVKLKNAIEILKSNLFIEFNDDNQFISLKENKYQYADYTIIFIENKQEYELLKEVLENDVK